MSTSGLHLVYMCFYVLIYVVYISIILQIVLMRYDVRRSKVHLINKLSRQAELWKNKKGTEEQVEKNQYKAERMIKEIFVINVRTRTLCI